jgi:SAM-dependent methyltransferase
MSRTIFKEGILGFYDQFIEHHTANDPGVVAWTCREAQHSRFEVLLGIGIKHNDTVLDLGCGVGGFVDYLKGFEYPYPLECYHGIDINQKYVTMAQEQHPGVKFTCGEIFDQVEEVDYVVGSGVFTVHMPLEDVLAAVKYSYSIAKKGVAFNFLTKDFLEMRGVNSYVPNEFYRLLIQHIQPNNCALKTEYYDNEDFTIYLYK